MRSSIYSKVIFLCLKNLLNIVEYREKSRLVALKMDKCWLFALFAVFNLILVIEAAPRTLDADQIKNLSAIADVETPVRYDGAQLWSVNFGDDRTKLVVVSLKRNFDVALWSTNGTEVDMFVKQPVIEKVRQVLAENNIKYTILINDMQEQIEHENPPISEIELLQDRNARFTGLWRSYKMPETMSKSAYQRLRGAYMGYNSFDGAMEYWPEARWGHRLTWRAYHRTADIFSFLDYLVATYPDLCSLRTIGQSVEKRPLKVLKISNGNANNKAIWIDGGIHAREWISPASVTYIVNDIVENWDDQPEHIRNVDWYVLPVHNPDGYEYTHRTDRLWRKNRSTGNGRCAGVDLNRNYGYKWGGKGTSQNTCTEIYAGRGAFSEPETAAVKRYLESRKEKFFAFLTFHSYGQYILHPWGYDDLVPPDHQDLTRVGREGALHMKALDNQVYQVGPSAALLYPAAGGSDDWAKSVGIKYAYTIELRDKGRYGFVLPAQFIEPTAKEARAFVFTVSRAVFNIRRKE